MFRYFFFSALNSFPCIIVLLFFFQLPGNKKEKPQICEKKLWARKKKRELYRVVSPSAFFFPNAQAAVLRISKLVHAVPKLQNLISWSLNCCPFTSLNTLLTMIISKAIEVIQFGYRWITKRLLYSIYFKEVIHW